MADPFYKGWGIRNAIFGTIKRSVTSVIRGPQQAAIGSKQDEIVAMLRQLGLSDKNGFNRFVDEIMSLALEQADIDASAINLPFLKHVRKVIGHGLQDEALFDVPSSQLTLGSMQRSTQWEVEDALDALHQRINNIQDLMDRYAYMIGTILRQMVSQAPSLINVQWDASELSFDVPLPMVMNEMPELIELMVQFALTDELQADGTTTRLQRKIFDHLLVASGGVSGNPDTMPRAPRLPTNPAFTNIQNKLVPTFLGGTYFEDLLDYSVPISVPQKTRFEHHHIVAGTGHGKTQTLQSMILNDLDRVAKGNASIVVLDSQGDLIDKIKHLDIFGPNGPLHGKLIVIDPQDIEYPVALNLFDVGIDRINGYSELDKEQSINSVLELYEFVLGSLLDAKMTQKQSLLFRYITRLMLTIPDATIFTFKDLLTPGGADLYREHIEKLQGSARDFFLTEFDGGEFKETKKQVLRRLWGILENQTFERMFSHPKSKLDIYEEMNAGKVILINTAKALLKGQGTEFFGRFFIAMIAQAAQERSVIPENERMPTFVYVDEAADYFDENIGIILSQARKYKVGMILAHQYLSQLQGNLKDGVFSNTSIKFAGGVSNKDASAIAAEMRTSSAHIESVDPLQMVAFVRGTTKRSISINIVPGQMECLPIMSNHDRQQLLDFTRCNYAVHYQDIRKEGKQDFPETDETLPDDFNGEGLSENGNEGSSNQDNGQDPTDPKPWGE